MPPGLYTKEFLNEGQILSYRLGQTDRPSVNALVEDLRSELAAWPADRFFRLLVDVRVEKGISTFFAVLGIRDLAKSRPDIRGRTAFLVSNQTTAHVVTTILNSVGNRYRERALFADEEMAVRWLLR
jgi:hypothetical protein